MRTLVVGAGAMGRWIGRVVGRDLDGDITFLDREAVVADRAATAVGGRGVGPDGLAPAGSADGTYDMVCIAVPIPAVAEAIRAYGPRARKAVIDLTGEMATPTATMAELSGCERASLHPLFAPDAEPGNVPVVFEQSGQTTQRLVATLRARGNTVFETTAAEHDRAMETVQVRVHAAVLAFALAADPVPDRFHTPVSAELTGLAARVTGGDPAVYEDIQATFDGADDVAAAARRVADAEGDEFGRLYREAGGATRAGDRDTTEEEAER